MYTVLQYFKVYEKIFDKSACIDEFLAVLSRASTVQPMEHNTPAENKAKQVTSMLCFGH